MYKKSKTPEEMFDIKQKNIAKRGDIKDKGIAFFNSTNGAIQMALADKSLTGGKKTYAEMIDEWGNWFYERWARWYEKETTIQPISFKAAQKANEEFAQKMNSVDWHDNPKEASDAEIDGLNKDLQAESDRVKQKMDIPIVEDRPTNEEMIGWKKQCDDEDNEQEMRAERAAEAHNNHIPEWDTPETNDIKENIN